MKRKICSVLFALVLALSFSLMTATPARAAAISSTATGGVWSATGTWTDGVVPVAGDTVTIAGGATVTVDVANAACSTLTLGSGSGIATLSFNSGSVLTVNSTLTIGYGTGQRKGSINMASGGILNLGAGVTVTLAGTWTPGTGTVAYNAAGTQTVNTAFFTSYNNLTLSGTSAKTTTGATVTGILSIEGTATIGGTVPAWSGTAYTLQYKTTDIRTVGAEWLTPFAGTGGVIIANPSGSLTLNADKVFNASVPLTINSGATLNTSAANNYQLTFGGNFVNNGGTLTANASPIVITNTMVTQSIAGFTTTGLVSMTKASGTATFGGAVNGAGLTINGAAGTLNLGTGLTHTFTGVVTLTAGTLNGGSSILNENATSTTAWNGTGTVFSAGTGTVVFGGVAQTLSASTTTFNNLTLSVSGIKTFTNANTVNGILSIEGTATATLTGALTYGGSATLQYKGSALQTTGAELPNTGLANLTINNTNGVNLNSSPTISGTLTLTLGTFSVGSNTLTLNGPTIAGTPANLSTTSSSSLVFGGSSTGVNIPNSVTALNNLTINNGNGVALNSSPTISGTLTLTLGTFPVGSNTLTLNGPTIAGTPANLSTTSSSSLVFGDSSTGVNIPSSVTALNNLTINNINGVALNSSPTINGILTLTNGNITTGSYTLAIASSGSVSRPGGTPGHVVGNLQKTVSSSAASPTFEVGQTGTHSGYELVSFTFIGVSGTGTLTVNATGSDHSQLGLSKIDPAKSVNVYWTATPAGFTFTNCNVTFNYNYNLSDIDGVATPANFIVGEHNGGWTYPTHGTGTATSIQATGLTSFSDFAVGEPATPATSIEIRAQNYTTAVATITFPTGACGATVSTSYNNVNAASPQAFGGAGVAKPVVTLVNTAAVPYTIWYNITTFTNGVVSNEYYLINAKGAACASADNITNAVSFHATTAYTTSTTIAATGDAGSADQRDLYLRVVLSAVAGKSGTSTITILGELG